VDELEVATSECRRDAHLDLQRNGVVGRHRLDAVVLEEEFRAIDGLVEFLGAFVHLVASGLLDLLDVLVRQLGPTQRRHEVQARLEAVEAAGKDALALGAGEARLALQRCCLDTPEVRPVLVLGQDSTVRFARVQQRQLVLAHAGSPCRSGW
jgi:hypothetical protein